MGEKNIGVFFGSGSVEHDISIITGQLVIAGLKGLGYPVTPVYITKAGKWMLGEELGDLKLFSDPTKKIEDEKKYYEYYLDMEQSIGKMVFRRKGLRSRTITIDLAFPALHGTFGEDGKIQGLFEMLGVPYVGCGVLASAVSMDKVLTKQVYELHKIPTAKFLYFYREQWEKDPQNIITKIKTNLPWPIIIKPAHLGSSIGISKVKNQEGKDLANALELGFFYDEKVIVEEAVQNLMDVTCCVIGNRQPRFSVLQESLIAQDVLDFESKYLKDGGAQTGKAQGGLVIPARLDEETTKQIQNTAMEVFKILECSGIARVDFLYDRAAKKFFVNEVNPLPGTLYHHLWKASGVELDELLQKLIKFAEEKYELGRQTNYTFESSVLKNLKGSKLSGPKIKDR